MEPKAITVFQEEKLWEAKNIWRFTRTTLKPAKDAVEWIKSKHKHV